jgi:hypothetical protein
VASRKETIAMSNLTSAIEKAAGDFALSIIAAVRGASLHELFALLGGTATRRGRPPRARSGRKPGRKPGRPTEPKAIARKTGTKTRKKIEWPKCKQRGCTKNAWAQGSGYCGEHAKKKAKR